MTDNDEWFPPEETPLRGVVKLPPGVCRECGGSGHIVYGDGGCGVVDKPPTETGYTETCAACGGSGYEYVHGALGRIEP